MKPRELRQQVQISARMRVGAAWGDVRLLNLSSRGVLGESAPAPPQGAYIEMRRGSHVIVARVVWADHQRFGACTQDRIEIDELIDRPSRSRTKSSNGEAILEAPRGAAGLNRAAGERHERSRLIARAMEFCFLVGSGAMFAGVALSLVQESVAAPMAQVSAALAPQ